MEPIYLPTHRLDPDMLAKYLFRSWLRSIVVVSIAMGFVIGTEVARSMDWEPVFAPICAVVFAAISLPIVRYQCRSIFTSKDRCQILEPRRMMIDGSGYQFDYQNGFVSKVPWSIVHHAGADAQCLILRTNAGAMLVPRSILDQDKIKLIYELVEKHGALSVAPRAW